MFLTISITFALIFAINSLILMGQTLVYRNNKTNKTTTKFIYDYKAYQIYKIAFPLFLIYIPYLLVLVFNIIVILRLRRPKRGVTREEEESTRTIMNEFTVSTISVDLIFLIFKAPEAFVQLFHNCFSLDSNYFTLVMEIFTELSNSYSDLLVFIFFFFEANFRKEIIKIFNLVRRCFKKLFRT